MMDVIKTERLILRPIEKSDAQDIFDNWASDPEVTKYLTWNHHKNVKETEAIVDLWVKDYGNPETYRYGIQLIGDNHLIGMLDIVGFIDGCPHIGYVLGRKFWNRGYMTEAFGAVTRDLFARGFDRILMEADVRNTGSNRVIQKCGFKFSHTETKKCSVFKPDIITVNWYYRENK